MTSTMPAPILKADRLYLTPAGEFVHGEARCAGMTAVYTGQTIDGGPASPITADDVAEWAGYDMGPLTCTCGALTATSVLGADGLPLTKAAK